MPKPPAPKVEVGQIWKLISSDIEFIVIDSNHDVVTTKVRYWSDSIMKVAPKEFLAKFEQVQPLDF